MATEVKRASKLGVPSLTSANNGIARWIRGSTSPLDQKGNTGWLAELYGGVQTGDDWARLNIPVNEMGIDQLRTGKWSWYQTNAEAYGVNIVAWIHDPQDFDKRAEISQSGSATSLDKGSGWNSHEFPSTADEFFYYGENATDSDLTEGTLYSWTDFQTDTLFSHWTVYRITLEWGWYSTGTFESAYIADVKFNGEVLELAPLNASHRKKVSVTKALSAASAYDAEDVVSETATNGAGTDWDFDFGGTGYITKAIVASETTALTPRLTIYLFTTPPTSELDDHAANTAPLKADLPYFVGKIDMPAMEDVGTGTSVAIASPSTYGNLPLVFDAPKLYGLVVTRDAFTQGATKELTISLSADMEDS